MIALNQQEREAQNHLDEDVLDVVDIWYTIQGEGPYAGCPAIFVRFAGCNLQCAHCDTDYTSTREKMAIQDVIKRISEISTHMRAPSCRLPLIVFTGGEPFRQNIGKLATDLVSRGYPLQVETNGTLFPQYPFPFMRTVVVCSPKTPRLHPLMYPFVNDLKYIIRDDTHVRPEDGLPTVALGQVGVCRPWRDFRGTVYIQPQDEGGDVEQNKKNLKRAIDVCLRFGYKLSIQQHKIIGVA